MPYSSIVYVSKDLIDFQVSQRLELAKFAAASNEALGISGYLYYRRKTFLQYIEGEHETLHALYSRIEADNRHTVTHKLHREEEPARMFPQWHMKHLSSEMLVELDMESLLIGQIERATELSTQEQSDDIRSQVIWSMISRFSRKLSAETKPF